MTMAGGKDRRLLIGFLGDDFSGSTDVLEVLTKFGLRTVLFTSPPGREQVAAVEGIDAVGIAGNTRSLPVERMDEVLRPAFERLRDLGASIVHYKVCSTFDSSPSVGSIGHVIDVGADLLGTPTVPIFVAAPELGRYCVFGNLFARSGLDSAPFRLDRHPTMSRHPVTPMSESDLRVHLAAQTSREVALLDVLEVGGGVDRALAAYRELMGPAPGAVLIDALFDEHLLTVGEVLRAGAEDGGATFVVGSSGVETALCEAWARSGVAAGRVAFPHPGRAAPILVLSGSCSPVTQRQVERALSSGFAAVAVDAPQIVAGDPRSAIGAIVDEAVRLLAENRSVVVHTALGPEDPRIEETRGRLAASLPDDASELKVRCGAALGGFLGRVGSRILTEFPLRRVAVTGGDTGWAVARELGIEALEMIAPMAPGSPLCRARGGRSPANGVEIVFKGGQVGTVNLLQQIVEGTTRT